MPQSIVPSNDQTASSFDLDGKGPAAEPRAFADEGMPQAISDGPAELLVDAAPIAGVNSAPADVRDGYAKFQDVAGVDLRPLRDATMEFAQAVRALAEAQAQDVKFRTQAAYGRVRERAEPKIDEVDEFVREKPYQAVGLAVLAGMALSGILRRH